MIGGDTLTELRQSFAAAEAECEGGVSPRVAPFADLRDVGALLQRAGFALPVTDVDRVVVRYDSAFALMADLRRMGATNILIERRRTPTRRATMLRMAQIYGERFADPDGRIRATFDVIWLSGWAPHESQQKPLRPGSAKASLEAAVKGKQKGCRHTAKRHPCERLERCSAKRAHAGHGAPTYDPTVQISRERGRILLCMGLFSRFCAGAACQDADHARHINKSIRCGISGMSAGGIG